MDDVARLRALFSPQCREHRYSVTFADGEAYDLAAVLSGQDRGEPPHADGIILRVHRGRVSEGASLFFSLTDVSSVVDLDTNEQLFGAE